MSPNHFNESKAPRTTRTGQMKFSLDLKKPEDAKANDDFTHKNPDSEVSLGLSKKVRFSSRTPFQLAQDSVDGMDEIHEEISNDIHMPNEYENIYEASHR